jgi:hypothetical protein
MLNTVHSSGKVLEEFPPPPLTSPVSQRHHGLSPKSLILSAIIIAGVLQILLLG